MLLKIINKMIPVPQNQRIYCINLLYKAEDVLVSKGRNIRKSGMHLQNAVTGLKVKIQIKKEPTQPPINKCPSPKVDE